MKKYIFKTLAILAASLFSFSSPDFYLGFLRCSDLPRSQVADKYSNQNSMFITLENGSTVHIQDEGNPDGEVLILLHGFGMSLHVWEKWVAELGDTYRLVSFDWQGGTFSPCARRRLQPKCNKLPNKCSGLDEYRQIRACWSCHGWRHCHELCRR